MAGSHEPLIIDYRRLKGACTGHICPIFRFIGQICPIFDYLPFDWYQISILDDLKAKKHGQTGVVFFRKPNELYTNIIISLINRFYADGVICGTEDIMLIASRRNTSKSLNTKFSKNVINHTKGSKINVKTVKPSDDRCPQAVDFVPWAFWQKYEKGDSTYADLLFEKTLREYEMYV
jgi:hypothetical protein